jgi:hypothetical protein
MRFSGWHRYKATNTLTLLYQNGPLVVEESGAPLAWLPVGRSLFRDKRIPRENLNGLLIPRAGVPAVLFGLTGFGGPWAQDPPRYARIVDFETGDALDWSHSQLQGWRGWQHDRWIYFYRAGGPIIVVDRAESHGTGRAALSWHLSGEARRTGRLRLQVRGGEVPAEVRWVPILEEHSLLSVEAAGDTRVYYRAAAPGRLHVATVFLTGDWVGAQAWWDGKDGVLRITQGQEHVVVPAQVGN